MKASKTEYGNRLCGVMCVRTSISTSESNANDNNFINEEDCNGTITMAQEANQTVVTTGFVEESKL